jgi:sn-glycerol 3-phosphate transport system ATP-binding protein
VDNVEYLGGDSLVTCAVGGQSLAVRAPGSTALMRGDATGLAWAPGAQHYFGADGVRHVDHPRHQTATQLA